MSEQKALSSVAVMCTIWPDARQSTPPDAGTPGPKPQLDSGVGGSATYGELCAKPAFLAHQPSPPPPHTHTHTHSLTEKELSLD